MWQNVKLFFFTFLKALNFDFVMTSFLKSLQAKEMCTWKAMPNINDWTQGLLQRKWRMLASGCVWLLLSETYRTDRTYQTDYNDDQTTPKTMQNVWADWMVYPSWKVCSRYMQKNPRKMALHRVIVKLNQLQQFEIIISISDYVKLFPLENL